MAIYQQAVVVEKVIVNAMDCPNCGVIFGVTEDFEKRRRADGKSFWCPNGHSMSYDGTDKKRIQELEAEATRAKQRAMMAEQAQVRAREDAERAHRQAAAARGQITKLKNRASAGVCIHCNRHFSDMERHVKSKHPAESPSHIDPSEGTSR